jgi:cell division septal protein FtsQ
MTEKKRLPEQRAFHTFKQPVVSQATSVGRGKREEESREAPVVLQRVVTIPEADPSNAWNTFSERQAEQRKARARPQKYVEVQPRTSTLTGIRASSGRIKAVRRPSRGTAAIPARSGRLARQRSLFWRILSLFAVSTLFILAVNFALTSNAFRVAQVNVEGTRNATLVRAIQQMGMQGENIFLVNIPALRERIEAIPVVSTAELNRQWPNQLVVKINERVPALLWQSVQGSYSIDGQGVVIARMADTPGADQLHIVEDISKPAQGSDQKKAILQPGVHLNQANILFARTIFDRLPSLLGNNAFKLQYDGTIYASTGDGGKGIGGSATYIVESSTGWKAYLGDASDSNSLDNRLTALQQILALAQKRQLKLATIDLRYGLRPVYTLR